MIKTQVVDNFLPQAVADEVHNTMMSHSFPWYYLPDVTYGHDYDGMKEDGVSEQNAGFKHTFLSAFTGEASSYLPLVIMLPYLNSSKVQMPPAQVRRVSSFMHAPNLANKGRKPNNKHVDSDIPHIVFLYYVCDSDGDTVVYTQDENNSTETLRVTPKKNRALIFDGSFYHASSSPVFQPRCIINFNLIPFEEIK